MLLDPGSFYELNPLIGHYSGTPGDGIITGSGTIEGRKVFVYSQDRTVQGGSIGLEHGVKMYECIERALEMRVPLIGLNDSPGARAGGRGGSPASGPLSIRSFSSFYFPEARWICFLPEYASLRDHSSNFSHSRDLRRYFSLLAGPDGFCFYGG